MRRPSQDSPDVGKLVQQEVAAAIEKIGKTKTPETYQSNYPTWFNMAFTANQKPKPEGVISYSTLRNFSIHYPVARACIDYLKTKILKLDFQVVPEDQSDKVKENDPKIELATEFFKRPMGDRSSYRQFIESILEDYLVIGAFSMERMRTRGGQFLNEVKLVDASTIQLMVDPHGRTPLPPDFAYRQVINGEKKAELTTDELIYIPRSYRTNSPYGISPIESLIMQAEAAIRSGEYNLAFFSEGNVPEGFLEMPENWTAVQIREFQDYLDATTAGNVVQQRRLRALPHGANYAPTIKPSELGFERFELWILQQTCSVFGVQPNDIGFTYQVNKSNGETQQNIGEERGMRPLAQLLEQVFTDIVQRDMGFVDYAFKFQNLDPVDAKEEAEIIAIKVRAGILSVDEVRKDEGLEPIGLGNYVDGNPTLVTTLLNPPEPVTLDENGQPVDDMIGPDDPEGEKPVPGEKAPAKKPSDEDEEAQKADLRLWLKQSRNAFKQGRPFKKFESNILDESVSDEVFSQLQQVKKKDDITKVFDPYLNNSMNMIKQLEKLTDVLTQLNATTS